MLIRYSVTQRRGKGMIWIDSLGEDTQVTPPLKLVTHARLVTLFEKSGDSEAATKHCRAIGEMKPWDPDQKPEPIYRVNPKYPVNPNQVGLPRPERKIVLDLPIPQMKILKANIQEVRIV